MMRKGLLAALAGAAALMCAGQAAATTIFNVDFTIDGDQLTGVGPLPFGLPDNPGPISGSFTVDLSQLGSAPEHGAETLTAFNLQVGSQTITLADLDRSNSGFWFAPNGEPNDFILRVGGATLLSAGASFTDGVNYAYCNNCLTYTGMLQPGAIPEPASWAMMLLGFFGLGVATRMRRRWALA